MNERAWMLIITSLFFSIPAYAQNTGTMPVPIFTDAGVQVDVTYDPAAGHYTYSYTISNPDSNTGKIWTFQIDVRRPRNSLTLSGEGLIIPFGVSTLTFNEEANTYSDQTPMVPVGQRIPPGLEYADFNGWTGGLYRGGSASFSGKPEILPGQSQSGFELYGPGLPGIREIEIEPWWMMVEESSASDEAGIVAIEIEEQLTVRKKTIGPTAPFGLTKMFEILGGYISESQTLGWLMDTALADNLRARLDSAQQLAMMDNYDPTQAKVKLGEFMDLLDQSSASQRTSEAYGLLYYNAKYIKDQLPDTPDTIIPPVILLDVVPIEADRVIGDTHELTVTHTSDGEPVPDAFVTLQTVSGPNEGYWLSPFPSRMIPVGSGSILWMTTDANGNVVFRYISKLEGTDELVAKLWSGDGLELLKSEPVEVTWSGGPDLVVEFFHPPLIKVEGGGNEITVIEKTRNIGNVAAGSSVTRYYLSEDQDIDPSVDTPLFDRQVPLLEPDAASESGEVRVLLPTGLEDGDYYMWACVDANNVIVETVEPNNCLKNQILIQMAMPIAPSQNQPPDCQAATPSTDSLWPPNHKLTAISVAGITDPDGDDITLTITGITQDEPVNELGDGDTALDGYIIESQAQLRAERSGTGNGRVYAIHFTANDGKGGECVGSVSVGVPHDRRGATPIDDGQNYDSTIP